MVTKGERIEDALAQAEAARERLEAALAEAEAALINTVSDAAKVDANWADANVKVEKARARCRQLRAALVDRDHSKRITRSRVRTDTGIKQSEELPNRSLPRARLQYSLATTLFGVKAKDHRMNHGDEIQFSDSKCSSLDKSLTPKMRAHDRHSSGRPSNS